MDLGLPLGSTKRSLKIKVESCSVRVAMSHLVLHRLVKAQVPVVMEALRQPAGTQSGSRGASGQEGGTAQEANAFRQSFNCVEFTIENEVSAWLCNDGSHSFGAPDVLQVRLNAALYPIITQL